MRRLDRRALVGGLSFALASGWNVGNLGGVVHLLAGAYGVSLATIGLFTTALFIAQAALQVPSGHLVDGLGAWRVGLLGIAALALGNAGALAAPDPALAIGSRLLIGAGSAICFVAGSDYTRSSGGSPFVQGLYGGIGSASGGIALALVPQLAHALGWRAPYVTGLAVALLVSAAVLAAPSDTPTRSHSTGPARASLMTDTWLLRLTLFQGCSFGLSIVAANWAATLLERRGGYETGAAAAIGSLAFLATIVARPLGGWITRMHPGRSRAIAASSCLLGALGTIGLVAARPAPLAVLSGLCVGLAAGIPFAYVITAAAVARPEAPGAAIGMATVGIAIANVIGTPLVGLGFSGGRSGWIGFAAIAVLWAGVFTVLPASEATARQQALT